MANGAITISAPNIAGGIQAVAKTLCTSGAISGVNVTQPGAGYTSAPSSVPVNGTGTVSLTLVSTATPPGNGYAVLDLTAGQPFSITECQSVSGFNVPTFVSGGQTFPSGLGPSSSTGSSGLSVTYLSPISGTDTSGYCTLTNWKLLSTYTVFGVPSLFVMCASMGLRAGAVCGVILNRLETESLSEGAKAMAEQNAALVGTSAGAILATPAL